MLWPRGPSKAPIVRQRERTAICKSRVSGFQIGAIFAVALLIDHIPTPALAQDYSSIRRATEDSVVFVHSKRNRKDGTGVLENSYGTGFVISPDGYVITASHVVFKEDKQFVVETTGAIRSRHNQAYKLEPVKRDEDVDGILMLFPDVGIQWKPVTRGNSRDVQKDAPLYALGFPGVRDLSPATGVLSNKFGPKGTWQTTLAINRGQSGGPIFDTRGSLVAVSAAGSDEQQLVTFAIPEAYLRGLLQLAMAKAWANDTTFAKFAPGNDMVSTKFTFYQAVDHQAQSSTREEFCLPPQYSISMIKPSITTQSGPETRVLGVVRDPLRNNCVTVDAFIKGAGVKKRGTTVIDYGGRGWLGMEVFLDATREIKK